MDMVVGKCLPIVKLIAVKGETLVVADHFLDIINGAGRINL